MQHSFDETASDANEFDRGFWISRAVIAILAVFILGGTGCVSSRVLNIDAYLDIPMNRVVPYPGPDELSNRAFEIVVLDRPSPGLDDQTLASARAQMRRGLEKISTNAGAMVIDRSLQELSALQTEGALSELNGRRNASVTGADFALAIRFSTYRYSSTWRKPFKFLWQSDEDVAGKPGTCSHRVEVQIDVQVIEVGANDRIEKTFVLKHQVDQKNKDLDPACTIAPVTLSVLFETALDDALACLRRPLSDRLAPRGHVSAHRKAPEAERHLFRISLGSEQGILPGDTVEILREQRSLRPTGEESRTERVLALGRVSDQVMAEASWVVIDPSKIEGEILDGDIVRPRDDESLLSSLSGPNCGLILEQR
jgi:hypothetical protein